MSLDTGFESCAFPRGGFSPSDRVRRVSCSVQILGEKNYNLKASILSSLKIFVKFFDRHP